MNFAQCIHPERRGNTAQCMRYGLGYRVVDRATPEQREAILRRLAESEPAVKWDDDPAPVVRVTIAPTPVQVLESKLRRAKTRVTIKAAARALGTSLGEAATLLWSLEAQGIARRVCDRAGLGWVAT